MQHKLDSTNLEVLAEGGWGHNSNLLLRKTSRICGRPYPLTMRYLENNLKGQGFKYPDVVRQDKRKMFTVSKFQNQRLNHLFMRK
ncbi:hypothetical protein [Bacillus sp. SD088]|uniref:hypothetical protein n=1 Tax=Bacillus sp. SD088 TaxID=2782012 RepID=UPI001A96D0F9|nr:hypothetical protein [Bacillus sp. SD088]MBO0993545.1 hypothetical protein [Bacillus sp. SD088]